MTSTISVKTSGGATSAGPGDTEDPLKKTRGSVVSKLKTANKFVMSDLGFGRRFVPQLAVHEREAWIADLAKAKLRGHLDKCKGRRVICNESPFLHRDLVVLRVHNEEERDTIVKSHGEGMCASCVHNRAHLHIGDTSLCKALPLGRNLHTLTVALVTKSQWKEVLEGEMHICLNCVHGVPHVRLQAQCPFHSEKTIPLAYMPHRFMPKLMDNKKLGSEYRTKWHKCSCCIENTKHEHIENTAPEDEDKERYRIGVGLRGDDAYDRKPCELPYPIVFSFLRPEEEALRSTFAHALSMEVVRIQPHFHRVTKYKKPDEEKEEKESKRIVTSVKEMPCGAPMAYAVRILPDYLPVSSALKGQRGLHMCPGRKPGACENRNRYPDHNLSILWFAKERQIEKMKKRGGTDLCEGCLHNLPHDHLPMSRESLCDEMPADVDVHAIPVALMLQTEREAVIRGDKHVVCRNCVHKRHHIYVADMNTCPSTDPCLLADSDTIPVMFFPDEEVAAIMNDEPGHHICRSCADNHGVAHVHYNPLGKSEKRDVVSTDDGRTEEDFCSETDTITLAFCHSKNAMFFLRNPEHMTMDIIRTQPHLHTRLDTTSGSSRTAPCTKTTTNKTPAYVQYSYAPPNESSKEDVRSRTEEPDRDKTSRDASSQESSIPAEKDSPQEKPDVIT